MPVLSRGTYFVPAPTTGSDQFASPLKCEHTSGDLRGVAISHWAAVLFTIAW